MDLGPEISNQCYYYAYQLDVLREDHEDMEDDYCNLRRELRDKTRVSPIPIRHPPSLPLPVLLCFLSSYRNRHLHAVADSV